MDLALNNLQRLICHKTQASKQHLRTAFELKVFHSNLPYYLSMIGSGRKLFISFLYIRWNANSLVYNLKRTRRLYFLRRYLFLLVSSYKLYDNTVNSWIIFLLNFKVCKKTRILLIHPQLICILGSNCLHCFCKLLRCIFLIPFIIQIIFIFIVFL